MSVPHTSLAVSAAEAVALGAVLAYSATPVAIGVARRFSFYDRPAGYKGHGSPTPYLGGAAVILAFGLALLVGAGHPARTAPVFGGALLLLVLGTIDDRRHVSPLVRAATEFALGAIMSALGVGWHLGAGPFCDALVTAIWVVAVVNAFNLFDNMDGAASTMAVVVSAGACALAWIGGNVWVAVGSAALCGSCIGFLPHNLSRPARIFLGDGGSMPIGFAAAILVANAARRSEPSLLALLAGILLVGLPLLDTGLVIVSRVKRQIPILTGGRDHLTHRTRLRMDTPQRVVLVLGCVQAVVSAIVVSASHTSSTSLVYVVLSFIVVAVVAIIALDSPVLAAAVSAPGEAELRRPRERSRPIPRDTRRVALTLIGALGLGAGLSPFFSGYYSNSVWLTLGILVVLGAAVVGVARPQRLERPGLLAVTGLWGLGLWSLFSGGWAHGAEQATIAANRWLAYGALLVLLQLLTRTRRHAALLLLAAGLGITAVAVSVLVRLLGADPATLFIGGRLNSPLGYVNGEACVFLMGAWLAMGLAECRRPLLAGLGAGLAVLAISLTVLSASRGPLIAALVSLAVMVAVVPGRRRRILALVPIAVAVGAAAHYVARVYTVAQSGTLPSVVAHQAGIAIVAAAIGGGIAWGLVIFLAGRWTARSREAHAQLQRIATVVAVLAVTVPLLAALVRIGTIESRVRTQWHAFVHLSATDAATPQTRLFAGSGNRYDYWRVSWHAFGDHPLAGVGGGNFQEYYFAGRRTHEAVQNPHSIEFQTLAELGVVGVGLLALFVGGTVMGARRLRRCANLNQSRTILVAAGGAAVAWFVDTSGDWMHLLPGVTAIAIAAVAALTGGLGDPLPREGAGTDGAVRNAIPLRTLGAIATSVLLLAVAGASMVRSRLALHYLSAAQHELAHTPGAAINDANRTLRLDGANIDAYYVKAAGFARYDQAAAARAALMAAARENPHSFVTWVLLGDLETRLRNFGQASAFYSQAHALDPNDPAVTRLTTSADTPRPIR